MLRRCLNSASSEFQWITSTTGTSDTPTWQTQLLKQSGMRVAELPPNAVIRCSSPDFKTGLTAAGDRVVNGDVGAERDRLLQALRAAQRTSSIGLRGRATTE